MTLKKTNLVYVALQFDQKPIAVGRLAFQNRQVYFEYAQSFLKLFLPISPFQLPLKTGVQSFNNTLFEGLPGVFNDSLPDGWGRLLLDRSIRKRGIPPRAIDTIRSLSTRRIIWHGLIDL